MSGEGGVSRGCLPPFVENLGTWISQEYQKREKAKVGAGSGENWWDLRVGENSCLVFSAFPVIEFNILPNFSFCNQDGTS